MALDVVVGAGLILLTAFALDRVGISFGEILSGAGRFFGW